MEPLIVYLIKVNVALVVLYTLYKLFFSKDTFFGLRRLILILMYIVAFLYPVLSVPEWSLTNNGARQAIYAIYEKVLPETLIVNEAGSTVLAYSWTSIILTGIYVAGILLLLMRTFLEVGKTCIMLHRADKVIIDGIRVCLAKKKQEPYSFFRWICIYPTIYTGYETKEILAHEQVHVRELHSVDILLAQLAIIFCWFNPFAWLIRGEMRINHEYLADHQVMADGYDKKTYQYHLLGLKQTQPAAANLFNNFSVLPLKNRIKMLNKKRTRNIMKSKYLMFIPVIALLIFFSNCANNKSEDNAVSEENVDVKFVPEEVKTDTVEVDEVFDMVEEMPEFPGGSNALIKFLSSNIKYPEVSQNAGTQGRVVVQFIVTKDGEIRDAKVIRAIDENLDKEALRVVNSMPKWIPGKQSGKAVDVKYTVPIAFRLQ